MGNLVKGDTIVRVKAIAKGVFTGASGSIVVCDPDGKSALARFPRVQAQDIRVGLQQKLISMQFDAGELSKSDQEGDRDQRAPLPQLVGEDEVDLASLLEYETATPQTTSFTNDLTIASVPGQGPVDIGDLQPEFDPETGEILDGEGEAEGEGDDVPPAGGKAAAKPAGKATTAAKA